MCTPMKHVLPCPAVRVHTPNGISIGPAVFAQLTAEYAYTLHWAALSKIAKTDEPIEMPFGMWTPVGPRKHGVHLAPPGEHD